MRPPRLAPESLERGLDKGSGVCPSRKQRGSRSLDALRVTHVCFSSNGRSFMRNQPAVARPETHRGGHFRRLPRVEITGKHSVPCRTVFEIALDLDIGDKVL